MSPCDVDMVNQGLINGEEGMYRTYTIRHCKIQTSRQDMLNLDYALCMVAETM